MLTKHFIARAAQEFNRPVRGASDEVLAAFAFFTWPGNIRQLRHVIERAVILAADEMLRVSDLTRELRMAQPSSAARPADHVQRQGHEAVDKAERMMLIKALRRTGGNLSAAARLTGYSRAQFYRLIHKHNITRSE